MNYRKLGKSELLLSELGFGCMSLGTEQVVNDRLIHRALDAGINFFDTADLYQQGFNETSVGKALRGKRQKALIATKVGNRWRPDGSGWDWVPGREYLLSAVDASLRRLGTDHIDLYQLHGGTMEDPIVELIETFELLVKQGKIRYYGISSIRPAVIKKYLELSGISSVLMQYSLLDRRPEQDCIPQLHTHQVGMLVRGALAKGLLVNKTPEAYLDHSADSVAKLRQAMAGISEQQQFPSAIPLDFVLRQPTVSSVLTGIRTMEQLEANLAALSVLPLAPGASGLPWF